MDFGKIARKQRMNPYAIRRIEEANKSVDKISTDDVINLRIELEITHSAKEFIERMTPRKAKFALAEQKALDDWFI